MSSLPASDILELKKNRIFSDNRWLMLICLVFFVAGFLRINDISMYNPDSTNYVILGNSLAKGQGFVDNISVEPNRHVVNAPLYSVVIAPIEILFPLSLPAVKVWTLIWGLLAVIALYKLLERLGGKSVAIPGAILFALNPLMVVFSTEALSEAPFVTLMLYVLLLCERLSGESEPKSRDYFKLAIALSAVVLLREIGAALVVAVSMFFLLRRRIKLAFVSLVVPVLAFALWYVRNEVLVGTPPGGEQGNLALTFQHFATGGEDSITMEMLVRIWMNLKLYASALGGKLLVGPYLNLIMYPSSFSVSMADVIGSALAWIVVCISPVVLIGLFFDLRSSATGKLRLSFLILYLLIVTVYPVNDLRFLFPLLPLILFYFLTGGKRLAFWARTYIEDYQTSLAVAVVVMLLVPMVTVDYDVIKSNFKHWESPSNVYIKARGSDLSLTYKKPWTVIGEWMQASLPGDAVIATPVKDLALVVGSRKIVELDRGVPLPIFERILSDQEVDYMLAPNSVGDVRFLEFTMGESRRFWFDLVFQVADLNLFKVHSRLADPPVTTFTPVTADTLSASWLLRKGRFELFRGHYQAASEMFAEALGQTPDNQELVYQALLAACLAEKTQEATVYYKRLFAMPQVLSLLNEARVHYGLMEDLASVRTMVQPQIRSVRLFRIASRYWDIGYPQRANEVMADMVKSDSSYFVGLLWGWDYAIQMGDTVQANVYLHHLRLIDDTNRVVRTFVRMTQLADSLRQLRMPIERSRIHLSIAGLYEQMQLHQEAIDEAMRARGEDPKNVQVYSFLAHLFEQRHARRAALKNYQRVLALEPNNAFAQHKVQSLSSR